MFACKDFSENFAVLVAYVTEVVPIVDISKYVNFKIPG
jgi:hypothetical protein